jgi:hypothetical protein
MSLTFSQLEQVYQKLLKCKKPVFWHKGVPTYGLPIPGTRAEIKAKQRALDKLLAALNS